MIEDAELFQGVVPFAEVAERGSFSQAAEHLGISTPAVSKAVRRLEERLGLKLLTRTSRSVELTPEGERYLERCREAIASMAAAREQMGAARRAPSGELRVSMSLILGPQLVALLPRFTARYPRVTLRISLTDRVSKLREEHIDVALRVGVRNDSALVQKRLFATRWVTVAAPAFIARHSLPRTPAELKALNCLRFILPTGKPRDFSFRSPDASDTQELPVKGNLLIDHGQQLLEGALAGLGVVQVLDFMVVDHLRAGTLVELLPHYSAPGPPICTVAAPERHKSPNVRAFNDFLGTAFAT
jgi:LysR family transcriptional regulator for bpeEF and oprC